MKDADTIDIVIFSIAVAFLMIGIHQVMVNGLVQSYWIFMLVFSCLIIYNLRKSKKRESESTEQKTDKTSHKKSKKSKVK